MAKLVARVHFGRFLFGFRISFDLQTPARGLPLPPPSIVPNFGVWAFGQFGCSHTLYVYGSRGLV